VWAPPVAITGVFLLLVYPRGHVLSRRWRWVAWVCGLAVSACILVGALKPGPMDDAGYPHHQNPFGIQALDPAFGVIQYAVLLIPLSTIAAVISLVIRFRRPDRSSAYRSSGWRRPAGSQGCSTPHPSSWLPCSCPAVTRIRPGS
jgi:hypothetical protein